MTTGPHRDEQCREGRHDSYSLETSKEAVGPRVE